MRRILSGGAVLAAAAIGASSAAAATVPAFPAPTVGPVFIAAQTVTSDGTMTNYFAPGSKVVFRAYAVNTKTKKLVAAKDMKFFYVKIPNQPNVKLAYSPTGAGATKGMPWVGTWSIPADFKAGLVPIDIRIKLKSRRTGQFVQMPVASSMLHVAAQPPALFGPAPSGSTGLVASDDAANLSLYVDSVNGSRPVGAAPRQIGCSQTNVYKRGEQVVFRAWGMDLKGGDVLSIENVKEAHVAIAGQPNLTLNWGAHGATDAKVNFWTTPWILPADFPLGSTTAHVVFTTLDGQTATFDYALNVIP
ncbi:MAG TPA: hypothetical protein VNH40_07425 [Gaiellaceae bacterium]|nr:hypothetical protein [Gaiellaceae bacterium]